MNKSDEIKTKKKATKKNGLHAWGFALARAPKGFAFGNHKPFEKGLT